jgi:hypothetical protein
MNDDARFERIFGDALHDIAPSHAPDRLRTQIKAETDAVRPRSRWLALIKEPPMRSNSRLAVGSPTWRVAAVIVATLLLAIMVVGASFAGAQILAEDGPIVVDPSGAGDYTTISDAVAVAEDGAEILVRPGTYTEAVVIGKDITVHGEGPPGSVVMVAPDDGPTAVFKGAAEDPYAILLDGSNATISDLTFRGLPSKVLVLGGSPTLDKLAFDGVGITFGTAGSSYSRGSAIAISDGSTATVSNNELRDGGPIAVFNGSTPLIKGNSLSGGPHIYLETFGDGTVLAGNTIDGTLQWAIWAADDHELTISTNIITNPGMGGITVDVGSATVRDNSVSGATLSGIAGSGVRHVIGNTLVDNGNAIGAPNVEVVESNEMRDGGSGLVIISGEPLVKDNTVTGMTGRGMAVANGASPTLSGNSLCGNAENLSVAPEATPVDDGTNEICEDGLLE